MVAFHELLLNCNTQRTLAEYNIDLMLVLINLSAYPHLGQNREDGPSAVNASSNSVCDANLSMPCILCPGGERRPVRKRALFEEICHDPHAPDKTAWKAFPKTRKRDFDDGMQACRMYVSHFDNSY